MSGMCTCQGDWWAHPAAAAPPDPHCWRSAQQVPAAAEQGQCASACTNKVVRGQCIPPVSFYYTCTLRTYMTSSRLVSLSFCKAVGGSKSEKGRWASIAWDGLYGPLTAAA